MLCEHCHEREAIVHVTRVVGDSEMSKHDYCATCAALPECGGISYDQLRAGWTSYGRGGSVDSESEQ